MNKGKNDLLKRLFKKAPPPKISNSEWDPVWDRIHAKTRKAMPTSLWNVWKQGLSYAAVLIIGIGMGVIGANFGQANGTLAHSPDSGPKESGPETVSVKDQEPEQSSEGLELFGLKNVKVKPLKEVEGEPVEYRLTGFTQGGVKIIWDYPALKPIEKRIKEDA